MTQFPNVLFIPAGKNVLLGSICLSYNLSLFTFYIFLLFSNFFYRKMTLTFSITLNLLLEIVSDLVCITHRKKA